MYDFLKSLNLVDPGRQRPTSEKNPIGLRIRIFHNGKIYPSQQLVQKFDLEYKNKPTEGQEGQEGQEETYNYGNGFDIVDSTKWRPLEDQMKMLLFSVVPKNQPKVDLFGSAIYNDDNTPKVSVMNQGTTSPSLLQFVKDIGWFTNDHSYCDLEVVIANPINTIDNIYYLPKTIEKGASAGQDTYVRRENITLYPVNIPENLVEQITQEETLVTQEETAPQSVPGETL